MLMLMTMTMKTLRWILRRIVKPVTLLTANVIIAAVHGAWTAIMDPEVTHRLLVLGARGHRSKAAVKTEASEETPAPPDPRATKTMQAVVEALISMGFKRAKALRATAGLRAPEGRKVEELLREALQNMQN